MPRKSFYPIHINDLFRLLSIHISQNLHMLLTIPEWIPFVETTTYNCDKRTSSELMKNQYERQKQKPRVICIKCRDQL